MSSTFCWPQEDMMLPLVPDKVNSETYNLNQVEWPYVYQGSLFSVMIFQIQVYEILNWILMHFVTSIVIGALLSPLKYKICKYWMVEQKINFLPLL